MIGISGLGKSYGARTLFEGVTLQLNAGSRYGLVGANGSGKTTLLRIVAGDEPASEGTVSLPKRARLGVLRQDRFLDDEALVIDLAMKGDQVVWDALTEQRALAEDAQPDPARMADLEDVIAAHGGYTLEARATEVLEGLGIPIASHRAALATLSGGFKLRVLLAQVLLGGADVLLLDEPTNHLDILSIRWLEKFLAGYQGCAVIISHDQRFLDNVTSHTLDVDYGTVTLYVGSYSTFRVDKESIRARKEAEVRRAEEEIARKRAFVERFGAKNTKAKQAQSRLKQIERIEVEDLADTSRRAPHLRFVPARPSGREVLEVEGVSKAYGARPVLVGVGLTVRRGERVAVIGANGLGKSTLLKITIDRVRPDAGRIRWGHEVRVGYFPQDHKELLVDPAMTPLQYVWAACPTESPSYVRGHLGRLLFSGDDVEKPVRSLSGGEAARLVFARIVVEKPNVLLLDEPTNHLDLEAIHALVGALSAFEGTVIFVSHDRWFVSQLATRVVEVTAAGLRDFPGTYPEYLERCGDDHLDVEAVVLKAKAIRREATADAEGGGSWQEQKRRRNRAKDLPQRRDRLIAALEQAEARKKAIQDLYCTPGFFENTPQDEITALEREQADLEPRIEKLMADWEEVERELTALGGTDAP